MCVSELPNGLLFCGIGLAAGVQCDVLRGQGSGLRVQVRRHDVRDVRRLLSALAGPGHVDSRNLARRLALLAAGLPVAAVLELRRRRGGVLPWLPAGL